MTPVALLTCALVLAASAAVHATRPGSTHREIASHGVLPGGWARTIALSLPVVEFALGGALAWAVATPGSGLDRAVGMAASLLFLGFAGYLAVALNRGRGGLPCACGLGSAPIGGWTVARAGVFAGLAGLGALAAPTTALLTQPWPEIVVIACAAVTFAIAVSLLPSARLEPDLQLGVAA